MITIQAKKHDKVQRILLEVNISGEESKYGLTISQIPNIIKEISTLSNIRFKGFMTMAPFTNNESEIRNSFVTLRNLRDKIQSEYTNFNFAELSMGMSQDFQLAIEEGSTLVRIGTAIFGERKY